LANGIFFYKRLEIGSLLKYIIKIISKTLMATEDGFNQHKNIQPMAA